MIDSFRATGGSASTIFQGMMQHELQSEMGMAMEQGPYMAVPILRSPYRKKLPYIAKSLHKLVIASFRVTRGSASTIFQGMIQYELQSQMGLAMVWGP